jgi:hypothetical protein
MSIESINILAISSLLYDCKISALRQGCKNANTAGDSLLDHKRNDDILKELKEDPVEKKLEKYKEKWLNYVSRMEDIRYPKQLI